MRLTTNQRIAKYSTSPDGNGCVGWVGTTERGYPDLRFGTKMKRVSILILEDKLGRPVRPGYEACHSCGHKWCVSSDHIYEGTHYQNMQDRRRHDGWENNRKGEQHPNATLTDALVLTIRASGLKSTSAARVFGISQSNAYRILKRQAWKHI